jgi:hypothetical protein
MQKSKVVFSEAELKLVKDQELILTKTRVIEGVYALFGDISRNIYETFGPLQVKKPEVFTPMPKISKGENYQGFPWVMLDYPRYFHPQHGHFALRIFFWWGHYFLVQIHLSGRYLNVYEHLLANNQFREFIQNNEVFAGNPADPWDCNLPQTGMERAENYAGMPMINNSSYGKIMVPIALECGEELGIVTQKIAGILAGLPDD